MEAGEFCVRLCAILPHFFLGMNALFASASNDRRITPSKTGMLQSTFTRRHTTGVLCDLLVEISPHVRCWYLCRIFTTTSRQEVPVALQSVSPKDLCHSFDNMIAFQLLILRKPGLEFQNE